MYIFKNIVNVYLDILKSIMFTNIFWYVLSIINKIVISSEEIKIKSSFSWSSILPTSASNLINPTSYAAMLPFYSNTDKFKYKNLLNCHLLPLIPFTITFFYIFFQAKKYIVIKITCSIRFSWPISRVNYRCAYLLWQRLDIFYGESNFYYDVIIGNKSSLNIF